MKEKLIGGLITVMAVPAMAIADASTVTISGRLHLSLDNMRVGDSEIESRNMVSDNLSYIRFSGKEDLDGGVNAIFEVESRIRGDTGGTTLGSRNNRVGLTGGFGTVFLGQ